MPKPRALRRQQRQFARQLARQRVLAELDDVIAEGPPPCLPTQEAIDAYRAECQRLYARAAYWLRWRSPSPAM